ncbi:hypothetical protein [Alkalihalobacterium elongatum]|uniref:hypothetical protein n=1 Tax=Alkalihalobacterium elongatum TaxID=2675466 RepID=UPI001C1FB317|nr:hypothetical protein [Alkalihalobacterium elongatum]
MNTASFQGMYGFIPNDVRSGFSNRQSHIWAHPNMYQGHFGYHPYFYPNYGNVGSIYPNVNHGHIEHYQPEGNHSYVDGQYGNQLKVKQLVKKQNKSQSPIKHHEYHWHHGYPFGQGSGSFPDYYNSNY